MHSGVGRLPAGEPAEQFGKLLPEPVGLVLVPAQGPADAVGEAHRAADAHVDPAGEEGLQDAELLGHDQRAVVREHHPARADADGGGRGGDGRGEDRGGRSRDPGHPVVLRHPEAVVAEGLDLPGEAHGLAQRLWGVLALPGAGAVEDGEPDVVGKAAHGGFNAVGSRGFPAAPPGGPGARSRPPSPEGAPPPTLAP